MTGTYNLGLVALSFAIALIASFTALDLAGRVQLAFQLQWLVNYDMSIVLLSLVSGVLASGIALWLLSGSVSIPLLLGGGGIMGIPIAWMHYTGMAAMQLMAKIEYDWRLVSLSVAIAISASFAALWLAVRLRDSSLKEPSPSIERSWLAGAIGIATLFILSLTLLTSLFDKRLTAQLVREQALEESEKRFRMLICEMHLGVLLLNANAEILIWNQAAIHLLNLKSEDLLHQVFGANWLLLHEDGSLFQTKELPVQQAIAVSSTLGLGTRFVFNILVSGGDGTQIKTSDPISKKIIGLAPDQPIYCILVAEDKPNNRLLLVRLLTSLGFDVREAEKGQEALAVWLMRQPHLIWMDMRMPVMDGYESTKQIGASVNGEATVIIALTASAFEDEDVMTSCVNPFEKRSYSQK